MTILDRVYLRLRDEYHRRGKGAVFDRLQGCLSGRQDQEVYPEAAKALRMSDAAVRVTAYRLRRRYGELLRSEIASTVSRPEEVEEEIHYLIRALANR
jgi:hypothetical protein